MSTNVLLQTRGLTKRFGGLVAVDGVDLDVKQGEIHALIGPNGAGKTTVLNLITRIYAATAGTITFDGHDLRATRPHDLARLGLTRTFQHMELFPKLSALDNVVVGAAMLSKPSLFYALFAPPQARLSAEDAKQSAWAALAYVGLATYADRPAAELTGGQGRLLGLARALAGRPKLILLDELVAGLNSQETRDVANLVRRMRDERGITVLLIEHDMRFVMNLSDRITVLNFGRRIASGSRHEIERDPLVIEAYLGTGKIADALG
ncbi:branched-chain amino acid transport system ATP-binding protein [Rhodoligotrophos appendicifer]|uniref:ABC transporter ATP-binding protein n=1 Tax=Rhodoligotrophos appendicifer TaxID=987056 RepID=UPI001184A77C|nr:ABC transporter ATP-binding protein [Rhodoligotrophos appendicifer]